MLRLLFYLLFWLLNVFDCFVCCEWCWMFTCFNSVGMDWFVIVWSVLCCVYYLFACLLCCLFVVWVICLFDWFVVFVWLCCCLVVSLRLRWVCSVWVCFMFCLLVNSVVMFMVYSLLCCWLVGWLFCIAAWFDWLLR